MAQLRAVKDGDQPVLYEICLRTGNLGDDASPLYRDPELLGHIYVGPYLLLARASCLVLEDSEGIAGYVVGTSNTIAFESACAERWWPPLQQRYPLPQCEDTSLDAVRLRQIHAPLRTLPALSARYSAHLHINILPRLQGRGFGRQLIDCFRASVAEQGATGLHLVAAMQNRRALAFYNRYGFQELGRTQEAVAFGIATA
ncbi:MAG: GNAT family N-acetyltransferase [Alphaproteobacteria bacterium]|nr:GNAT family N-acetyltransferase [Alphaproteobacteria bacterium]